MMEMYILDEDKNIVQASSLEEWSAFVEDDSKRRVDYTAFLDGTYVSTVFLSVSHGGSFFETMIFSGVEEIDEYQERCRTWKEALKQHQKAVERVRKVLGIEPKVIKLNFKLNG